MPSDVYPIRGGDIYRWAGDVRMYTYRWGRCISLSGRHISPALPHLTICGMTNAIALVMPHIRGAMYMPAGSWRKRYLVSILTHHLEISRAEDC
jgi:hypothetical protein